jgi:Uma2 family endonuclease
MIAIPHYISPDDYLALDRQNPIRHEYRAEVLSSSTEAFDRDLKFTDYQNLDSLEEYVLISQDSQRVECCRRIAADTWETTIYEAGDRITLTSLDLEFSIDRLYRSLD